MATLLMFVLVRVGFVVSMFVGVFFVIRSVFVLVTMGMFMRMTVDLVFVLVLMVVLVRVIVLVFHIFSSSIIPLHAFRCPLAAVFARRSSYFNAGTAYGDILLEHERQRSRNSAVEHARIKRPARVTHSHLQPRFAPQAAIAVRCYNRHNNQPGSGAFAPRSRKIPSLGCPRRFASLIWTSLQ